MNEKHMDLTGQRFGRLLVLKESTPRIQPNGKSVIRWTCICDCGNIKDYDGSELRRGNVVSCGCYSKEQKRKRMSLKNKYKFFNDIGYCFVEWKGFFIFDKEDYDLISQYQWNINELGYARSYRSNSGKKSSVYVHNLIMNHKYSKNSEIDHIDGNPRNNRKSNLRISTHMQNMKNMKLSKRNKSGYKGVCKKRQWKMVCSNNRKWETYVFRNV